MLNMTRDTALQHMETVQLMGVDFVPMAELTSNAIRQTNPIDTSTTSGNPTSKQAALDELRQCHDATCPHCTVVTSHTQTVFGEGNPNANLMFVGEAPGEQEDLSGRPFVGRAGKKLDEIIKAMGLSRDQVYIANILKSRPPNNRTPLQDEVDGCATFLAQQVQIIEPQVIVALGGPATKFLLDTKIGITRLRGRWGEYDDGRRLVAVMPTFHPAYLLRNYTPQTRQMVWDDMLEVKKLMGI